jgi:Protein of unknown function (DUF3575)
MKKLFGVIVLTFVLAGARAQILATSNSPEYKNLLKMSASLFTQSTFQLGFERFFQPNTSFYLAAGLKFEDSEYEKNWGVRTELQMRFHVYTLIRPRDSHRLYFAPYVLNEYFETETIDYASSVPNAWILDAFDAFGGGMLFGWSYSFANRINLDIYTGGGIRKTFNYDNNSNSGNSEFSDYGYSGIVPRLGIDIGFWF